MNRGERLDHQKFKALAALAQSGTLSTGERLELDLHLQVCRSCRQAYEEYVLISQEGMDFLAAVYDHNYTTEAWDDGPAREKLLARARANPRPNAEVLQMKRVSPRRSGHTPWVRIAAAACVLVALVIGAYKLGGYVEVAKQSPGVNVQSPTYDEKRSDELISSERAQLELLQIQASKSRLEVGRLREALRVVEARSAALASTNQQRDQQIHQIAEERDKLDGKLREAEQSYQLLQAELTKLRTEHDSLVLRTASYQSKLEELSTETREQDRRIKDDEQYLASDRDIRELMGARKLYIADVFDVDSGSRTRKPFGRVFYTQNKSLIFYAFDLDRQPGVKTASAFQVWGQKDAASGEKNPAMNLGILYMDNESNRRWVLRLDDPKQLAEIDAVFVTVEPHGGSQKPTGKPFLYALLRKEANHP